jgi:hypothetical protein
MYDLPENIVDAAPLKLTSLFARRTFDYVFRFRWGEHFPR